MRRERITITIEADLLPAIDKLVDGEQIRNRSHALEVAVRQGLALTQLTHIFFIYSVKNTSFWLEKLRTLLQPFAITHSVIIAAANELQEAEAWHRNFWSGSAPTLQTVPAEFGSAAALVLSPTSPQFLIINLAELHTPLPQNLLPAFTLHIREQATVTEILYTNGSTFTPSGILIASQALIPAIPAGRSSLREDIFPALAKVGKVSTYAYAD